MERTAKGRQRITAITARHSRNQKQILRYAALRSRRGGTCHPDPALREKNLLFFVPRDEVGAWC